ncbi:MAG: sigma-70 family RNA polymerase sigma factor [Phycisphaerales bacterium]|nr:sigma-70 family RNA polymerase sigma factor [Planctomycetota bacterium]
MTRIIRSIAHSLLPRLSSGEVLVLDDASALDRYARIGDPRAFEVLVHRYQAMVVHTCARVMKSTADAEDAAQETFLKLARRAGEIRSNVAAWLHACALRTSIDLLRARATQQRAEGAAASEGVAQDETERTWREIKPLLDDAIAALQESDRELIVSRFLVGRPQVEMAREAKVNPGTMHRRIDAALEKLRKELTQRGVSPAIGLGAAGVAGAVGAVGAVGASGFASPALAGALTHASAGPVSSSLTSSFMSVGLAEMGNGVAGAGVGTATIGLKLGAIALASILGLGAVGGGLWFFGKQAHTMLAGAAPAPNPQKAGGFDRPAAATRPARLVSQTAGETPDGVFEHDSDMIRVHFGPDSKHPIEEIALRVLSVGGEKVANKAGSAKGTTRVRVEKWTTTQQFMKDALLGKERDCRFELEGELLTFYFKVGVKPPEPEPGKQQTVFIPEEAKIVVGRIRPPRAGASAPSIPAIAGEWGFVNDCQLELDKDFLTLSWLQEDGSAFPAVRIRVLEWENAGPFVRIQGIFAANQMDMGLVGQRVKVLARRDEKGWTIAWNDPKAKKLNEWPAGLDGKTGEIAQFSFQDGGK